MKGVKAHRLQVDFRLNRLTGKLEVVIAGPLCSILHLDGLSDDVVCHVVTDGDEVSAGPRMPTPELTLEHLIFAEQLSRTLAFEVLNDLECWHVRRCRNQNVPMVFGNMTLDDFDIHGFANLPDQFPYADRYPEVKHRLGVFGDPSKVESYVLDSVRGLAVVLHNTASRLKTSPRDEGLSPIPRRGQ